MTKPAIAHSLVLRAVVATAGVFLLAGVGLAEEGAGLQEAGTHVTNIASLQSRARAIIRYCSGCHSRK
jgi:hypothetical protein